MGPPEASAAANLIQPLSLGCAEPAPLEGEPLSPTTAVAEMVEVWYYDTITGEKETHYAADIRI